MTGTHGVQADAGAAPSLKRPPETVRLKKKQFEFKIKYLNKNFELDLHFHVDVACLRRPIRSHIWELFKLQSNRFKWQFKLVYQGV